MKEEFADVFYSALLLAHKYQLDVDEIVSAKLRVNEGKYPVGKAKGVSKKWDELDRD